MFSRFLGSLNELRPHSAFVAVAFLLVLAVSKLGIQIAEVSAEDSEVQPWIEVDSIVAPTLEIVDRHGATLARSVPKLDLVASPNALWQAHTPRRIAKRVSEALRGDLSPEEFLTRLLPGHEGPASDPWLRVPDFFAHASQTEAFETFVARGTLDPMVEARPIPGMWFEPGTRGWDLVWCPLNVLSAKTRAGHDLERSPLTWTRRLADGLASCLGELPEDRDGLSAQERREIRESVWARLLPSRFVEVIEDFNAQWAPDLHQLLVEERISDFQMSIRQGRVRAHPAGHPWLVGDWNYPDEARERAKLLEEFGWSEQQLADRDLARQFEARLLPRLAEAYPSHGLELAADRVLASGPWADLGEDSGHFSYRRQKSREVARSYFRSWSAPDAAPVVETTLDLGLQRYLVRELEGVVGEHDAAMAMGIVVDVENGEVLAVGSHSSHMVWGFNPVYHLFTPGSTFKVIVMATALQAGVVRPESAVDVGTGPMKLYEPGRNSGRHRLIHEAEHPKNGVLTATQCLAHSSNRGMVRIGLRVDADVMHDTFSDLGYGDFARSGLGGERPGRMTPLPWKYRQTHASMCFGHEVMVNLWQHAGALATVLRGGESFPLRICRSVQRDGEDFDIERGPGTHVFDPQVCELVRDMMREGARIGTGRHVARPELSEDFADIGTKTGTAEKVHTEICLHAELGLYERNALARRRTEPGERSALRGVRPGHASCYTSSMCVFGRGWDDDRELMVLVVVEEPRGKERFGSAVAGPTAMRILRESLGLTRGGEDLQDDLLPGFVETSAEPIELREVPWAEDAR